MSELRNQFAMTYQQLKNWQPPDAASLSRKEKLLQVGYMIGTGGAALASAQTHLIPYLKTFTGPVTIASQGADGLMALWTKAASAVMTQSAGLSGLQMLDTAMNFGPAVLLGVGVVLLFFAASKSRPRVSHDEAAE